MPRDTRNSSNAKAVKGKEKLLWRKCEEMEEKAATEEDEMEEQEKVEKQSSLRRKKKRDIKNKNDE